ncbi:MAG: hypothetical protein JXR70_08680 [Spirochaetales bacterium]|nr:hypothetical protein [Spirochaetales bacterium]
MNSNIAELLIQTQSIDNKIRINALNSLLRITEEPVDWFRDVRNDLSQRLKSENSFQRSIGMMLLCNLAKSDIKSFDNFIPNLLELINDEKFITRRQTIQNI